MLVILMVDLYGGILITTILAVYQSMVLIPKIVTTKGSPKMIALMVLHLSTNRDPNVTFRTVISVIDLYL